MSGSLIGGVLRTFLENGEIHIDGEIDEHMADYVHDCFVHLKGGGSPKVKIFIRSLGGLAPVGFQIYDEIRHYGGDTHGIVNGSAHSMGAIVLQGCTKRSSYRHSTLLVHNAIIHGHLTEHSFSTKGSVEIKKLMKKSTAHARNILIRHTGLSSSEVRKLMKRDEIMTASEALKLGLIDTIC